MRLTLYSLLILLSFRLHAQEKLFEQYVGWNGLYANFKIITNKTEACTFVMRLDSLKAFLMTGEKQFEEIFTVPVAVNENYLGGFIKQDKVYLFMDNGNGRGIRCWLYDKQSKEVAEHPIPFELKKTKIINRLSSDNYFFYFTYNKKTKAFEIYKFSDEKKCDTLIFPDDGELWENVTIDKIFYREVDIQRADTEGECDVATASARNKLYVRNDSLLLIINDSYSATTVYSFDLTGEKLDKRSIRHVTAQDYPRPAVYNSFLLGNELYFCSAGREGINLQVLDFYSGKIINEFYAVKGEDIAFINTNIGSVLKDDVSAAKGKTGGLLKEMSKGNVVVIAQPLYKDSAVVLTIASFREVYMPGGAFITAGGNMIATPGSTWESSTRFKTMLHTGDFKHIPGKIPLLIDERTDNYCKDIRLPKDGKKLYSLYDNYYFTYYDKKGRTFNVVKFDK